jgi:hypothetical protein
MDVDQYLKDKGGNKRQTNKFVRSRLPSLNESEKQLNKMHGVSRIHIVSDCRIGSISTLLVCSDFLKFKDRSQSHHTLRLTWGSLLIAAKFMWLIVDGYHKD